MVLEYVLELNYSWVMETFVDLDFRNKLLPGAALNEGRLRDDLGCQDLPGLEVSYLVALSEPSFS
jgi:hypothetical protein